MVVRGQFSFVAAALTALCLATTARADAAADAAVAAMAAAVSPAAKLVKTYALPDEKKKRTYRDFRVCEKTESFYLLTHPDPTPRIVCVGFDGKERWAYDGPFPLLYDATRVVGVYQRHSEYVQVITGHMAAPSGQSQPHRGAACHWFKRIPNGVRLAYASAAVSPARLPSPATTPVYHRSSRGS